MIDGKQDDLNRKRPTIPLRRNAHILATAPSAISLSLRPPPSRDLTLHQDDEKDVGALHYRVVDPPEQVLYKYDFAFDGIDSSASTPPIYSPPIPERPSAPATHVHPLQLDFRHVTVRRNVAIPSVLSSMIQRVIPSASSESVNAARTTIINDIHGTAKSGELFAILASSGAGKTTLLNVLAGRSRGMQVSGSLLLNGEVVTPSTLSAVAAYVMQSDVLIPTCTAREHVQFHANMTVPYHRHYRQSEKVESILRQLDLLKCADDYVGISAAGDASTVEESTSSWLPSLSRSHHRGLSGGEQRRVSIAMSLVHNPALLFCDEPTSGLDSTTAYSIVKTLKKLCSAGRTVIITIHSPSAKMIALFDQMMLLTPNGELAFVGAPHDALSHFAQLGHECPITTNAADFCLSLLHGNTPADHDRVKLIVDAQKSQTVIAAATAVNNDNNYSNNNDNNNDIINSLYVSNNLLFHHTIIEKPSLSQLYSYQLYLLIYREYLNIKRNIYDLIIIPNITNIILSLFIGLLLLHCGNNQRSIYERIAFIFFNISMIAMITLVNSVLTFTEQRALFFRERSNHLYRTSALFLAVTLVQLPLLILQAITLSVIGYWMIGLQSDLTIFFNFVIGIIILALASNSLGQFLGALSPSALVAVMLTPLAIVPFMLTSGFFINLNSIPIYLIWLKYLSPHYYIFISLFSNEFNENLRFFCDVDENIIIYIVNTSYSYCYLTESKDVLTDLFHIQQNIYNENILYAFLLFLGYRILAFLALTYRGRVH